uniref:Proteasome subunit beta n=2 Tax=Parascaris univalens TaxID=6257 RepID=A0A915BU92_PARUN
MIQQRWFVVVGQLLFSVGKIHSLVSLEQWQCGTDNKTREMAYNSAEEDCPDVMDMFNECCIVHDTCYADQLGKGNCDDQFCECMNIAASKAKQISDCQMKAFAACMAVQMFGSSSYEEAVRKPHIIEYNSNDSTKHLNAELTESSLKSTTSEDKLKSGKMETTVKKEFTVNMTTTFADSTKPSKHICIVEDILPKHIYTEIFEDCPIYKGR